MKNLTKTTQNLILVSNKGKFPLIFTQQKTVKSRLLNFLKSSKLLKFSKALNMSSKILTFFAILSLSIFSTSCVKKVITDTTPPVLKTNYSPKVPLRTDKSIDLVFDEAIKAQSINTKNIILLDTKFNDKPVDPKKYEVKQDEKDKKKIVITIKDDEIKGKKGSYKIKLQNISDESGNIMSEKILEIAVLDSISPTFSNSDIDTTTNSVSSSKPVVLTFSEALKTDLIKANIILKDESKKDLNSEQAEKYEVVQDETHKNKISLILKDEALKNQTAKYTLEIKQDLTDEGGNKLVAPATINFTFIDSVAPSYIDNTLDKTTNSLSSSEPLVLKFSEALKSSQVNSLNFVLKKDNKELSKNQYSVELKNNTVEIGLNETLKNQTAEYILNIAKDLTDKAGNKFELKPYPETIYFTFKDEIPPHFKDDNLGTSKQIKTNETIVLNFNEDLMPESVNQDKIALYILKNDGVSGITETLIDKANYKVEQDAQDKSKVKVSLTLADLDLRKNTADFKLKISGVQDLAKNSFKDNSATTKEIQFKFIESLQPRFIGSNIFDNKVLEGAKKITLLFDEEITEASASQITIKKNQTDLTASEFTAKLAEDKKTIEISFLHVTTDLNTLFASNEIYEITIPNTILDLADNRLENPQTLKLDGVYKTTTTKTFFVTETGDGDKKGGDWQNATTLNAILESNNVSLGDTILVAQGTYYADSAKNNIKKAFNLKDGVKIYGGFDQNDADKPRNFEASILEGKLSDTLNTKQILKGEGLSDETVLDGFVIQNALNTELLAKGAGLYLKNSNPKLTNLVFKNNILDNSNTYGGAIYNEESNPSISNCKFSKNHAYNGGVIYNDNSSPSISNSVFVNNSVNFTGAVIYNNNSNPNISNSLFSNNSAKFGGTIYNDNSNPNISNSTIISNSASKSGFGVAIYNNNSSSPSISNSILWNNIIEVLNLEVVNNIYNRDGNSNPTVKNSILNKDSAAIMKAIGGDVYPYNFMDFSDTTKFKDNQTPENFVIADDGRITDKASKELIRDKGDNALYLEVYNKIHKTNPPTEKIPATETDLAGKPRLIGSTEGASEAKIDIGAYELQD